jgi:hypothetical protein
MSTWLRTREALHMVDVFGTKTLPLSRLVEEPVIFSLIRTFIYGGTGMYPGRGFTHFDFGPLRSWVG